MHLDVNLRLRLGLSIVAAICREDMERTLAVPELQVSRNGKTASPGDFVLFDIPGRGDAALSFHFDVKDVGLGEVVQVLAGGLGGGAELAGAQEPDAVGEEDAAFDEDADDEEASAEKVKGVLRDDAHEGEESPQQIDGEEDEIDADDPAGSLPELKVRGQ